jgi:phospholipid transport system substrate-binding protein
VKAEVEDSMKTITVMAFFFLIGLTSAWGKISSSPQDLIKETSQRMIEALNKNREVLNKDPSKIYDLVNEIILPNFNFELMSRWVLGKHWRQATPDQRTRFTEEFRTLLVRTYAGALLEYSNEEIRYLPMPPVNNAEDVTVRTEFLPKNRIAIPIDYRMHFLNGAWKVYDVTVDGVSLVTNYRGSFASQIREGGIESVINDLKKRNQRATH